MSMAPPRASSTTHPLIPGWSTTEIVLGCDYNPEQWDAATWVEDARLMNEAGVDLVALNVFGWASLEPRDGELDFRQLDTVIDLLHEAGIKINLGTGTSSPPPWLTRQHPEILPRDEAGVIAFPGGRQAWCPSSPVFRSRAALLASRMAARYGAHPAVALWHVSNELGCHNARCYCDVSAEAFRRWLRARYGDIETLNAAWGTSFWSQHYGEWDDILPPRRTLSAGNPAHDLDFRRFSSDELLEHYRAEEAAIREHSALPVTTNLMVTAHISTQDYWSWRGSLDLIANDHYVDHRLADPLGEVAFSADWTRGLAKGAPWMLMETSTSAVSWQPVNHAKPDGDGTLSALAHVARGADSICFFQWRQSQRGAEKFHSALLPHGGTDATGWQATLDLSRALDRLSEVVGSRVTSSAAMVVGWDAWWAAENESHPSALLRYLDEAHRYHRALRRLGVTVDMVPAGESLEGYDLVVVPTLYAVSDAAIAAIEKAAHRGATVLVTPFSGIADETDAIRLGGYPGAFRDVLGVVIDEFRPLGADETVELSSGARGTIWTDSLRLRGAEARDAFMSGPAATSPALTRHAVGDGAGWYIATVLDDDALDGLVRELCREAGVAITEVGCDVDVVTRRGADADFVFVLNHGDTTIPSPVEGHDLLSGADISAGHPIAARTALVVRQERTNHDG